MTPRKPADPTQYTGEITQLPHDQNPFAKDHRLTKIPDSPTELELINNALRHLQNNAKNAGVRNPVIDLLQRLTVEVERISSLSHSHKREPNKPRPTKSIVKPIIIDTLQTPPTTTELETAQ